MKPVNQVKTTVQTKVRWTNPKCRLMEKIFILAAALIVAAVVTFIFGTVIGPKLLEWIAPSFNKATNKLDDAITGKPDEWEMKVREITETKPEQLNQRMADIFSRFAKPSAPDRKPPPSILPSNVRSFFEKYSELSFDGQRQTLDASVLHVVTDKTRQYVVIGRDEDDMHFYAVDLQDRTSVMRLEMDERGGIFRVEEDAPSFEHFVTLQYELHLSNVRTGACDGAS